MTNIHTILTHVNPHMDEIMAIWLLRKFGAKAFNGVDTSKVCFYNAGWAAETKGKTPAQLEKEGILCLGILGGNFDEHPNNERGRIEDECAASLVARHLGMFSDPTLQKILKYVVNTDVKSNHGIFDLATLVKDMHDNNPNGNAETVEWAIKAIDAKFASARQFGLSDDEWARVGQVHQIDCGGIPATVAIIAGSDNTKMSQFARTNLKALLVVQKTPAGQVYLFTNRELASTYWLPMGTLVGKIRDAEQQKHGRPPLDFKLLEADGSLEDCPEWYYGMKGEMLLNGSRSHPEVPPTALSLEEILSIIRLTLKD